MIENQCTYSGILPMININSFNKKLEKPSGEYAVLLSERKSQHGHRCFSDLGQELKGSMVGHPWLGLKNGPWNISDSKNIESNDHKWKLITDDGHSQIYLKLFNDSAPFADTKFKDCHWVAFNDMQKAAKKASNLSCLCCKETKSLPLSKRTAKALNAYPLINNDLQDIQKKINNEKNNNYITNIENTFVGDVHGNLDQLLLPLLNKGIIKQTEKTVCIDIESTKRVQKSPEGLKSKNMVEIPEVVLNPDYKGNPVTYLGDYIDHCSLEKGLKAFYLLCDILNQQKVIKEKNQNYEAATAIVGNHEFLVLQKGKVKWNLRGAGETVKKKYAKALKGLICDGRMQISHARGGILSTHSCISKEFLLQLLKEVDKNNLEAQKTIKYFLDDNNHSYTYLKDKKIKKLNITDKEKYNKNIKTLSDYINNLAVDILSVHGKFDNGKTLKEKSVLFRDTGMDGAITPFWTTPRREAPVSSIQMAYGHVAKAGQYARSDKFKDGLRYKHIVCYDGGSYLENQNACYSECDKNGKITLIKKN